MFRLRNLFKRKTAQDRMLDTLRKFERQCTEAKYAPFNFYLPKIGFYYHESQFREWLKSERAGETLH